MSESVPNRDSVVEALDLVDDLLRGWGAHEVARELQEHAERALEYFYPGTTTRQEENE